MKLFIRKPCKLLTDWERMLDMSSALRYGCDR
jgi:hypothetical protein